MPAKHLLSSHVTKTHTRAQICAHTDPHTQTEPPYVLDESANKVQPHSRLMASHPPRPSEQYSEMKYGQEF